MRYFLLLLFTHYLFYGVIFAQQVTSGHMVDQLELIAGDSTYLTIKGFFDEALFEGIQVFPGETEREFQVDIPHAFLNNVTMSERQIVFTAEDALEKVEIGERIRQTGGGSVDFLVNMKIYTKEAGWKLALDRDKSDAQQLTFSVQPTVQQSRSSRQTARISRSSTGGITSKEPRFKKSVVHARNAVLLHPVSAMLMYQHPLRLNVSVLNASSKNKNAQRLAILLERQQRRNLEERIGMKVEITNISSVREGMVLPKTKIYFRPNFLKAALTMSEIIPGEQIVERMPSNHKGRMGTDIEVYVGENFE